MMAGVGCQRGGQLLILPQKLHQCPLRIMHVDDALGRMEEKWRADLSTLDERFDCGSHVAVRGDHDPCAGTLSQSDLHHRLVKSCARLPWDRMIVTGHAQDALGAHRQLDEQLGSTRNYHDDVMNGGGPLESERHIR